MTDKAASPIDIANQTATTRSSVRANVAARSREELSILSRSEQVVVPCILQTTQGVTHGTCAILQLQWSELKDQVTHVRVLQRASVPPHQSPVGLTIRKLYRELWAELVAASFLAAKGVHPEIREECHA